MDKLVSHSGVAAPLNLVNVDTDMIIPKQYLKTIKRTGLSTGLFDEMRHTPEGDMIESFPLLFFLPRKVYDQSHDGRNRDEGNLPNLSHEWHHWIFEEKPP